MRTRWLDGVLVRSLEWPRVPTECLLATTFSRAEDILQKSQAACVSIKVSAE